MARHQTVSLDAPLQNRESSLADSLPEGKPLPIEELQHAERVAQIKSAVAALPEDLRTPLILVEYEDMSQAEIAEILGCKAKAVENRLYRARKLLRTKLTQFGFAPGAADPEPGP